ncbi:MAG: glycoside hydrolase family 3 N-terminal domain-containing protein [Polyangiaceae bacterium]
MRASLVVALAGSALVTTGCRHEPATGGPFAARAQPPITSREVKRIVVDGLAFRDLDRSGSLTPYEDWRRPTEERVTDLLGRMSLDEKAGLLLHPMVRGYSGPHGEILPSPSGSKPRVPEVPYLKTIPPLDDLPPDRLVRERHVRWMLLPARQEPPETTARYSNEIQAAAERTRLGIPAILSSDPRHTKAAWHPKDPVPAHISRWPYPIGLAALRDPHLVERFGRIAAHEYRALGLHVALSPSADIATEPRWNRIEHTFGEDPELVGTMVEAYVRGFQGAKLGPASVATVTKHFPGNGPMKGGYDSHNHYGKWQTYPGGQLSLHEKPFTRAIAAGTAGIMPGYGIAEGFDTVGMGFSRVIVTDHLRKGLGFTGLVVTDWLHYMPWGLEETPREALRQRIFEAGCDQLGDDNETSGIVALVQSGKLPESRIDESARRVLRIMFDLGVFESPFVDEGEAARDVGRPDFVAEGLRAQAESVVVLTNPDSRLPWRPGAKLHAPEVDAAELLERGIRSTSAENADAIVVKMDTPFVTRKDGTSFFRVTREGPLAYTGADNEADVARVARLAATGKPVVVLLHMERPGILTELVDIRPRVAILAHFGSSDGPLLDVTIGRVMPKGRLPFDLPRTVQSVDAQQEDVPFDLTEPLFRFGHGLSFEFVGPKPGATSQPVSH